MYEPIGYYTPDGDAICADCYGGHGEATPVFPDSETDSPSHCVQCEALIPEALTAEGIRYVREAVEARTTGRGCILRQWWEAYGDLMVDAYREELNAYYAPIPETDSYSPRT